jgi:hypothetical protein
VAEIPCHTHFQHLEYGQGTLVKVRNFKPHFRNLYLSRKWV